MAIQWKSNPKDVELEAVISRAIRERGSGIHVSVKGNHITVSGMADDFETKREIVEVVKDFSGGREVTSNIRVVPMADFGGKGP